MRPKIIAHRGYSALAPENTIPAIQKALDAEVDFIEFDVQFTKDGVPVLFHDQTLERTTDIKQSTRIDQLNLDELKQIDAGNWFDPAFRGTQIPTLDEVLKLKQGHKKVGYMIEIKSTGIEPKQAVEKILQRLIDANINPSEVCIASFDDRIVSALQEKINSTTLGIANHDHAVARFLKMGVKHLALDHVFLSQDKMDQLKKQGITVWSYTVDDPHVAQALLNSGVHGIITNDPHIIKTNEKGLNDKTT
jgi:glycerophosphoryl diester phosphodiesterase